MIPYWQMAVWSVFRFEEPFDDEQDDPKLELSELTRFFGDLVDEDVVVRGVYDVGGLRADADVPRGSAVGRDGVRVHDRQQHEHRRGPRHERRQLQRAAALRARPRRRSDHL